MSVLQLIVYIRIKGGDKGSSFQGNLPDICWWQIKAARESKVGGGKLWDWIKVRWGDTDFFYTGGQRTDNNSHLQHTDGMWGNQIT